MEFGNWLNQLERAAALNECADALQDLAGVLQIKPEDITQAGTLAMAFGSRGISGAAAHYEPIKRVINLTKRAGAGCLAHEWWHALDNYIMTLQGEKNLYAVADYRQLQDENLKAVAADLYRGIYNSPFADRSRKIDTYKSKKYWGTMVELSARAFEAYVRGKLEKAGYCNDYLVNYKTVDEYSRADFYPYPTDQEAEALEPLFDAFFSVLFTERADDLQPVQTQEPEAAEAMANDAAPEEIPAAASESMADSPAYGSSEKSLTEGPAYGDSEKSLYPGTLYGNLQKSLIFQEYERIKKIHSERLIIFRLSDHYGLFYDDAGKASEILGIPLSEIQGIPFAAFRHYELDTYLPRLIRHGVRVGIVDSSPLEQRKVISRTARTTTE